VSGGLFAVSQDTEKSGSTIATIIVIVSVGVHVIA
jgi:hypothetical protein